MSPPECWPEGYMGFWARSVCRVNKWSRRFNRWFSNWCWEQEQWDRENLLPPKETITLRQLFLLMRDGYIEDFERDGRLVRFDTLNSKWIFEPNERPGYYFIDENPNLIEEQVDAMFSEKRIGKVKGFMVST